MARKPQDDPSAGRTRRRRSEIATPPRRGTTAQPRTRRATGTRAASSRSPRHPLVDAGLHWGGGAAADAVTAVILDVIPSGNQQVGDLALLQLFDENGDELSARRLISLTELAQSGAEHWVIYASVDEMKEALQQNQSASE